MIYEIFFQKKRQYADDELHFLYNCLGTFEYTEDGFYDENIEDVKYKWIDICEIIVYKEDLITTDCIYLEIRFSDNQKLSLYEELPGWHQFIIRLEKQIPLQNNWLEIVSKPAFKENKTTIYKKEGLTLSQ